VNFSAHLTRLDASGAANGGGAQGARALPETPTKNSEIPVDMSCGLDTVAGKMIFSYPRSYSSVRLQAAGCSSWT